MERKYKITLKVPLGDRTGTLSFTQNGTLISGVLNVFEKKNIFAGTISKNGKLYFSGQIASLTRNIPYTANGAVLNDKIHIKLLGERNEFIIDGEEIFL